MVDSILNPTLFAAASLMSVKGLSARNGNTKWDYLATLRFRETRPAESIMYPYAWIFGFEWNTIGAWQMEQLCPRRQFRIDSPDSWDVLVRTWDQA